MLHYLNNLNNSYMCYEYQDMLTGITVLCRFVYTTEKSKYTTEKWKCKNMLIKLFSIFLVSREVKKYKDG